MHDHVAEIDAGSAETLEAIADAAEREGVGWIVTGAMARWLVFEAIHGYARGRYTRDWDLGIQVEDWPRFRALEARLIGDAGFRSDPRRRQRMHAPDGMIVDLIPFGGVETEHGRIRWDHDDELVLDVAGFRQAFEAAYRVRLNDRVTVRVVSPPALVLLKLVAWRDRHHDHDRDAEDLAFLLRHFHALITHDLHEHYAEVMAAVDYDIELAGPRVLGQQAAAIAGPELRSRIGRWLDDELEDPEGSALLASLSRYMTTRTDAAILALVRAFRAGWVG